MSSLTIFPSEILECITSVLATSQQVRLWQCGDRILNINLKNGGLKRTSLCWPGWAWMPWSRWYFTTFDGLVDVEWCMDIGTSLCPMLDLNLLPKTLNRLHLACEDVFILLRQQNINMHEVLPFLHSLHLSGRRVSEKNLKNLPSNLIELQVVSLFDKVESSNIFGDLPRHIRRLTLTFDIEDQSELENDLPSDLISLDIHRLECDFNWFSKLSKSLKTLKIAFCSFEPDWRMLPPQLETLNLQAGRLGRITKSALLQLPPSLKTLELYKIKDLALDDELVPLLPKNLTRFSLPTADTIDHSGLAQLPTSLTDFDVTVSASHPDIVAFFRPDTIRIRLADDFELNVLPFPTKLTCLEIGHINDEICAMLPTGLQQLTAEQGLITSKGAATLPKSLTVLSACLDMFDDNQTFSYIQYIPNLRLMARESVQHFGQMNQHWISSLLPSTPSPTSANPACSSTSTGINGTNEHLTSLTVVSSNAYVKQPYFDALPNFINLTTLKFESFSEISSDSLCLIPQSVTNLKIGYLTSFPTATQISLLPTCLRYLNIGVPHRIRGQPCDWNDETLQSLPRSLQEFHIDCPYLTQRMYEYVPPNLRLRFSENMPMSSNLISAPLDRLYGNP